MTDCIPVDEATDVQRVVVALSELGADTLVADLARHLDWGYDRCLAACDAAVEQGLVEAVKPEHRRDTCPECGGERWELIVAPERFFCGKCEKATPGPNGEPPAPEPEQMGLGIEEAPPATAEEDGPPLDEGMAWIADEMPDE